MSEYTTSDPIDIVTDDNTKPKPDDELLLDLPNTEFELPANTEDDQPIEIDDFAKTIEKPDLNEMSPDQRKEYVAGELVKLMETGNREDLAAYMREVLSAQEPLHPIERGVVFELLEKAERAKIGRNINKASESAFKELAIENDNKASKESGFCYDASRTMIGIEDDHLANIRSKLRFDTPVRPIMSNYDALKDRARKIVLANIESVIDTNQTDGTHAIMDKFDSNIRKYKEQNESLDQTARNANKEDTNEIPDLYKLVDPDVFDETVDSLVAKVKIAKEKNTSPMVPVMELLDAKPMNIGEAIAACEYFIKQHSERLSETRQDIDRPAQDAKEKIEYFIKNASNAEFDARDLNDALAMSGKQAEIISSVRGKLIAINSLIHERQAENAKRINQFHQTIDDLTRPSPAMSKPSQNAILFN